MELLQRGSRGPEVSKLQNRLNELGWRDAAGRLLSVDGSFGPATEFAVNAFKDAYIPGGNLPPEQGGQWRGMVGQTTWDALAIAEPVEAFCTLLQFVPPVNLNTPSGTPWSNVMLESFKLTESGQTVLWLGAQPRLLEARDKFVNGLSGIGMRIERYTSAVRPLIQQAHFWDLRNNPFGRTAEGQAEIRRHGLSLTVGVPRPTAPHVAGRAFDAIVVDSAGKRMNPLNGMPDSRVLAIANAVGLRNFNQGPTKNDGVHWELN